MGIRFACHVCHKPLNIKRELGGKRGICPGCASRIRIPTEDSAFSSPVDTEDASGMAESYSQAEHSQVAHSADEDERVAHAPAQPAHAPAQPAQVPAQPAQVHPESPPSSVASQAAAPSGQAGPPASFASGVRSSVIHDDPEAIWYVRPPSGGQYGPATGAVLEQWIDERRVAATALVWRDGWSQWREARDVLAEFADRLPGTAVEGDPSPGSLAIAGTRSVVMQPQSAEFSDEETRRLYGESDVGGVRRQRSMQRLFLITLLSVLAMVLVGVLWYVLSHGTQAG